MVLNGQSPGAVAVSDDGTHPVDPQGEINHQINLLLNQIVGNVVFRVRAGNDAAGLGLLQRPLDWSYLGNK